MPKRNTAKERRLANNPYAKKKQIITAEPIDPQPASGLDAIGQAEWKRIREAFEKSGRLTELDQAVLCLYCSAYSRWKRAEHSLLTDGDVLWVEVRNTHGKVTHTKPIVNPLSKVAEAAARATHRFGDALGLSPAARTKQGYEHEIKKTDEEESEFDDFVVEKWRKPVFVVPSSVEKPKDEDEDNETNSQSS
jgi:P27 family predicted phage terminase small subunit